MSSAWPVLRLGFENSSNIPVSCRFFPLGPLGPSPASLRTSRGKAEGTGWLRARGPWAGACWALGQGAPGPPACPPRMQRPALLFGWRKGIFPLSTVFPSENRGGLGTWVFSVEQTECVGCFIQTHFLGVLLR